MKDTMPVNFTAKLVNEWLRAQGINASDTESALVAKVLVRLTPNPILPSLK